jgi:arginyl-tRNA synthetase
MVRLIKDGEEMKMSKRTGNGISIQELCEDIGTDAVRYFFVARAASSHLDFDLDLATSTSNDNPVYYAQYAYARICSILNSAKEQGILMDENSTLINNEKEIQLLKQLNEFPSLVVDAAISLAPSKICNYIQKVAQLFHGYYGECRVIDQDNISLSSQRLALLEATRIVLQNAFNLIAIECKEKM